MSAATLAWLAVIAVGSQLLAVVLMWRLQRVNNLEIIRLQRRDRPSREERAALIAEEARIAAEVTAQAVREAQFLAIRDEVRQVFEETDRG